MRQRVANLTIYPAICLTVYLAGGVGVAFAQKPANFDPKGFAQSGFERKFALVVGNSKYPAAPLKNPANDAISMQNTLNRLGFEVTMLQNLDLQHFDAAIDEFTAKITPGSVALFYFSGHGIQVNFTNYLLPVDFLATNETDVKYKAYAASRVQERLEASGARLRLMVFDACRNNPYHFKREAVGGLAQMSVNAEGTLIAFATGDNNTADDNREEMNGLYTKFLMPALLTPGLQIHEAFRKAKEDVYLASMGVQNPSIYENIVGQYYLVAPPSTNRNDLAAQEASDWEVVRLTRDINRVDDFLLRYPGGAHYAAALELRNNVGAASSANAGRSVGSRAGEKHLSSVDGLEYVWIPSGSFSMGCSDKDSECALDEKPSHMVEIAKGFWMTSKEVTVDAYRKSGMAMQSAPGFNTDWRNGAMPIVKVNWQEAEAFCARGGGRLPTEAEWEYAARAGTTDAWGGSVKTAANLVGIADGAEFTSVGGKYPANAWGLWDMRGNAAEWTLDWYARSYGAAAEQDPQGPDHGDEKVIRGGSFGDEVRRSRVSARWRTEPQLRLNTVGFRCMASTF